jgi:hypothetical protein
MDPAGASHRRGRVPGRALTFGRQGRKGVSVASGSVSGS